MSNPTGDALHAGGLEDAAGVIQPVGEKNGESLQTALAKMKKRFGALFKSSGKLPHKAA